MEPTSETGPTGPSVEAKSKETKTPETREQILDAFTSSYDMLQNTPDSELSPDLQAAKDELRQAKEKTLDKERDYYYETLTDAAGNKFRRRVYPPVDHLQAFLKSKIESGTLSDEQINQYKEYLRTLIQNSKPHRTDAERFVALVQKEYERVKSDPCLSTDDKTEDYKIATERVNQRRELVLPSKRAAKTPLVTPAPPPETPPIAPTAPDTGPTVAPAPPEAVVPAPPETPPTPPGEPSQPDQKPSVVPAPQPVEEIRRIFAIVNRSIDPRKRASEIAEKAVREEQRRGSAFNPLNWARKVRMRVLEEYYKQQYKERALNTMLANNNSYLSMDVVNNSLTDVMRQIEKEKEAGYAKAEEIKIQSQEGINIEGQQIKEAQGALKEAILKDIIKPLVGNQESNLIGKRIENEKDVQEALKKFVQEHQDDSDVQALFGRDATQYGTLADYFATDLLETGKIVKEDLDAHKYTLEQLDNIVKIQLANTSWAAETQANFNRIDKAIAWTESHKLRGWLINPATVGAAASITAFAAMRATGATANTMRYVVPGAGIITGAAFAALRRNQELKIDRAAHQIERAYNEQIPENAPRRKALENYAYDTSSVNDLLNGMNERKTLDGDTRGLNELLRLNLSEGEGPLQAQNNREAVLRRAAEIQKRLDFSALHKVDLVTFQSKENVEQGRLALIKGIAEAKIVLRKSGMSEDQIKEKLNHYNSQWDARFTQNKQQQDRSFMWYRARNAAGSALFAGAMGGAAGLLTQEGIALTGRSLDRNVSKTVLERAYEGLTGNKVDTSPHPFTLPNLSFPTSTPPAGPTAPSMDGIGVSFAQERPIPNVNQIINLSPQIEQTQKLTPEEITRLIQKSIDSTKNLPNTQIRGDKIIINGEISPDVRQILEKNKFTIVPFKEVTFSSFGPLQEDMTVGHKTRIPGGTEWVKDASGKFDLVIKGRPDKVLINDATFDNNGKMRFNPSGSLFSETSVKQQDLVQTDFEIRKVLGENGEWKKLTTSIDERQWYAYNTPFSEKNELTLYTHKEGDNGVSLDMSKMKLGYQKGLEPNPINVQEVINNKQSVFAFTVPGHGTIIVEDGADGTWDGMLKLNPNDTDPNHVIKATSAEGKIITLPLGEFSKMVINQQALKPLEGGNIATELFNRRDVFKLGADGKMGTIEAGRLVEKDGKKVFQAFATIFGKESIAEDVQMKVEKLQKTIPSIETAQKISLEKPGFEITPPERIPQVPLEEPGKPQPRPGEEGPTTPEPSRPGEKEGPEPQQPGPGKEEPAPPPSEEEPLIIPIPFSPRHPLEKMYSPEPTIYYSQYGVEAPRIRLRQKYLYSRLTLENIDLLDPKLALSNFTGDGGMYPKDFHRLEEKPSEAIDKFRKEVDEADNIFIVLPYHIGDSLSVLGYSNAIVKKLEKLGNKAIVHLVVPDSLYKNLKLLEKQNLKIVPGGQTEPRIDMSSPQAKREHEVKGINTAINIIKGDKNIKKAVVIDFENLSVDDPEIRLINTPTQDVAFFTRLFQTTFGYGTNSDGNNRYLNFASDLLNDQDKKEKSSTPILPLVPTETQVTQTNITANKEIDKTKPRISIVLESGSAGRQYSTDKWAEVAKLIQEKNPETQISFIINPNKPDDDPTKVNVGVLSKTLQEKGVHSTYAVTGSIYELLNFFSNQDAVLSNDGGILHLATCIEKGPKVIGLYFPGFSNHWRLDTNKVIGIEAPQGLEDYGKEWGQTDDDIKWINKINPQEVADKALEILKSKSLEHPTPSPDMLRVDVEDIVSDEELREIETWANSYTIGYVDLYNKTPEEKETILRRYAERIKKQKQLLKNRYKDGFPPTSFELPWEKQTNRGMLSCQFASAGNALRALNLYNPAKHSERNFIDALGGDDYARGASTSDVEDALGKLSPEAKIRKSNSVDEILQAVEKGAAVIVELSSNHVGIIQPGNRVIKDSSGELSIQVIDPLTGPRVVPIDTLIKSDITLAEIPEASPGIIIEKPPSTSRTTTSEPLPTSTLETTVDLENNTAIDLTLLEQFSQRNELEQKEVYLKSLERVLDTLKNKDAIVELKDFPTIVIPDLHARREFLVTVLNQQIKEGPLRGRKIYDLLKEGKINIVCLGDAMHSEKMENWDPVIAKYEIDSSGKIKKDASGKFLLTPFGKLNEEYGNVRAKSREKFKKANPGENANQIEDRVNKDPEVIEYWKKYYPERKKIEDRLMREEMIRSLGLMKMIMDLKTQFPESFHYVRGNHDDMDEAISGYYKYANESEDVKKWVIENFGEDFLKKWAEFDASLPFIVKGKDFVASHAAPETSLTLENIKNRESATVKALTWTDNRTFISADGVSTTLQNIGLSQQTPWIIGHRNVTENDGKFRSQFNGKIIQINNPDKLIYGFVPNDTRFNPSTHIYKL